MADQESSKIVKGIIIKGRIEGGGNIHIEGEVEGEISIQGDCTIGEQGFVKGDITSNHLIVLGKVKGNLAAREKIEIHSTAEVDGDIKVKSLSIADGSCINGNVLVGEQAEK